MWRGYPDSARARQAVYLAAAVARWQRRTLPRYWGTPAGWTRSETWLHEACEGSYRQSFGTLRSLTPGIWLAVPHGSLVSSPRRCEAESRRHVH
jgi:hypothetical protein